MTVRVRAPGRVNLIGDHTDYTGGLAFPLAIDRWTEIEANPAGRFRLTSLDEATTADLAVGAGPEDGPGADGPSWARYVAAVAAELGAATGLEGSIRSTIPIGAGLSSSAALELALALALGFEGTPLELAELGRRAEHRATGVPTGIMDQLCIASARPGHATLIDHRDLAVRHVPVPDDVAIVVRFVAHRTLEGSGYAERVAECAAAEGVVGPLSAAGSGDLDRIADERIRRRARHVVTENQRVLAFVEALADGDHRTAGEVMVAGHASLRDDFEVSTPVMDAAVAELLAEPSVHGARMTGGGFGGCVVALCRPDTRIDGWRVRPVGGAERME